MTLQSKVFRQLYVSSTSNHIDYIGPDAVWKRYLMECAYAYIQVFDSH